MTREDAVAYGKQWDSALAERGDSELSDARVFLAWAILSLQVRKTGKWNYYRCSECKCLCTYFLSGDYVIKKRPNYCPNCGAKMEMPVNENDIQYK